MDFYLTPLAQAVDRHGRKATGLRSLIEAGAKVPDGIALDQVQVAQLLERDPRAISSLKTWLGQHQTQLAVRSSAANEDGEILSFAGMYATDLKIKPDIESVLASISRIATSGQSNRILHYSGSLVETIPVVIQEMVAAQISGVLFTRAILPNGDTGIYVEWIYGIGEQLVSGHITPASFSIPWNSQADALDLQQVIINRDFPDRRHINALITLVNIVAPLSAANRDIEWAIGSDDTLYALQIRPATTDILVPSTRPHGHPLPASPGIAVGPARLVDDTNYADLREGEVLVAKITEVDYVPSMRKAVAVVTEEGGLLSHAAIVARELGIPCVVGVKDALACLKPSHPTEVDGNIGLVRQGDVLLGGSIPPEVDWTAVYVYDKGIELVIGETPTYIEPTLSGLYVHVDESQNGETYQAIEAEIRRKFRVIPHIVESDRRIWYREWRRFEQLQSIRFIESLFCAAVSAWDRLAIARATAVLKKTAASLPEFTAGPPLNYLFIKEAGAALHALVAVVVEGQAVWSSYRDSARWRQQNSMSFRDFVQMKANDSRVTPALSDMLLCLSDLSVLRNEAYSYFREVDAFDGNYFSDREELVRQVCIFAKLDFTDEDTALSTIYGLDYIHTLDRELRNAIIEILKYIESKPCSPY